MTFLGALGIEFASIAVTLVIKVVSSMGATIKLAEEGYVFDTKKIKELQEKGLYKSKSDSNAYGLMRQIIFFIPGMNVFYEAINGLTVKSEIIKEGKENDVLIKISDKDAELIKKVPSIIKKLELIITEMNKEDGEEIFGIGDKATYVIVDHDLSTLNYDKLPDLGYSLNDIKILNNITTYSYRLGTIDGENVAVIGIPNPNSSLKRVKFSKDNIDKVHVYVKMTEDEAVGKTFKVYPFVYSGETKEELDKAVEEIRKYKETEAKKYNNELINNTCNCDFESVIQAKKEEGPVLRKTRKF